MNAYQVLGVDKNASQDTIKNAYRRLAMINHPDRCAAPGATEALKAINVAYTALTTVVRRMPEFADNLVIFRSREECEAAAAKAAEKAEEPKAQAAGKAPRASGVCKALWAMFDYHWGGQITNRASALKHAAALGINPSTAKTQWQRWRTARGV